MARISLVGVSPTSARRINTAIESTVNVQHTGKNKIDRKTLQTGHLMRGLPLGADEVRVSLCAFV